MPPEQEAGVAPATPRWQFRLFVLMCTVILGASMLWLLWAALKYSPTSESDVLHSLIRSEILSNPNVLLTLNPSTCRTDGVAKGAVSADLFATFLEINRIDSEVPELYRFRPRQRVVDSSKPPFDWYIEERTPVISISRIAVLDERALVCIEIFAAQQRAILLAMRDLGSGVWNIEHEELVWSEEIEVPEELP